MGQYIQWWFGFYTSMFQKFDFTPWSLISLAIYFPQLVFAVKWHMCMLMYFIFAKSSKNSTILVKTKSRPSTIQTVSFCSVKIQKSNLKKGCTTRVVHLHLGLALISWRWEASLPDVGLSKSVRVFTQSGQYLLRERFVSPTKKCLFVGETNLSPRRNYPLWVQVWPSRICSILHRGEMPPTIAL